MMRRYTRAGLLFSLMWLAIINVSGCASNAGTVREPLRFYEGSVKQKEEIAILKSRKPGGFLNSVGIDIRSINGEPSPSGSYASVWDGSFNIALLPGDYALTVGYSHITVSGSYTTTFTSENDRTVNFEAVAGRVYELSAFREGDSWIVRLVDEATGITTVFR